MKKLGALLPVAFFVMLASTAYSQSLADLANKEKERRAEIKDFKVITDEEAAKYKKSETTANAPDQLSGKKDLEKKEAQVETQVGTHVESQTQAQAEKPDRDEPTDFQGRTESYWRKTMADARQKVKDLENETNVLILKRNDLQNKFYNLDSGFQREAIQRDIQKNIYEQDSNKENLEKAKATLQDLENEARKSGALPGWIEAQNP